MLLVISKSLTAQLKFDSTCYNVVINEGTSIQRQFDGSVRIDNAFDIITNMTKYAKNMLASAVWNPNLARGNRQRVLRLLVELGLPQEHPNFHDMVNALMGKLIGIHESLRGADARDQLNIPITQFYPKTGIIHSTLTGPYTATPMRIASPNTPFTPKTTGT